MPPPSSSAPCDLPSPPRSARRARIRRAGVALGLVAALLAPSVAIAVAPPELAPVYTHGPRTTKRIALTIDDGFRPEVCMDMARTLLRAGVTATWFPVGRNVARWPETWRWIAQRFPVANHTRTHSVLSGNSERWIRRDIRGGAGAIRRATGRPAVRLFRPPGGVVTTRVRKVAAELGWPIVNWDTSNADTVSGATMEQMYAAAMSGTRGSILLMHCNWDYSADLLPRIIAGYRARGYRFVTVTSLLGLPERPRPTPGPTPTPAPAPTPTPGG